jgi:phage-related protein
MFFGQIFHAITLVVMGFGQLVKVLPVVFGAFGKLSVVAGGALKLFMSWPMMAIMAVTALLKVLSKMGVDVAGFFTSLAASAVSWGENLAASLANGFLAGAVRFIYQAVAKVASMIASFFESHSPPEEGPLSTINKWGSRLMDTYLKGFRNADFSILSDVGKIIENILTRGISDEALPNALKQVAKAREIIANLVSKFNDTGVIDEGLLGQATSGLGYMTDKVKELVRIWLKYNQIQERLKQIEALRKGAIKSYTKEIAAIGASNMSIEDKIKAIRASQRARDDGLRGLSEEEEALQEESDQYKEQLDYQKQMISALQEQDDLLQRIADAIKSLSEKLSGGGGGGGDMGFGDAEDDINDAKTAMEGMISQLDTIIDRFKNGKKELQGFIDGFNGLARDTNITKDTRDLGVAGGNEAPDLETQSMYDMMYDLGVKADEVRDKFNQVRDSISGIGTAISTAFGSEGNPLADFVAGIDLTGITESLAPLWEMVTAGWEASLVGQNLSESWQLVKDAVAELTEPWKNIINTLMQTSDASESLTFLGAVELVLAGIGYAAGWVAGILASIIGGIAAIIATIIMYVSTAVAWLVTFMSGVWKLLTETMMTIAGEVVNGFINGWENFWPNLIEKIGMYVDSFIAFVKSLLGIASPSTVFFTMAIDIVQGIIDGITEKWGELTTLVGEKIQEIITLFGEYVDEFLEAGKSLIGGIWSGVEEKWNEFLGWLGGQIDALPEWVKKLLGIASPSKVMAEVGRSTMEGFVLGFKEVADKFQETTLGASFQGLLVGRIEPLSLAPAFDNMPLPDFGDGPFMVQVVLHDPVIREESDIRRLSRAVADELQKTNNKRVKFGGNINL